MNEQNKIEGDVSLRFERLGSLEVETAKAFRRVREIYLAASAIDVGDFDEAAKKYEDAARKIGVASALDVAFELAESQFAAKATRSIRESNDPETVEKKILVRQFVADALAIVQERVRETGEIDFDCESYDALEKEFFQRLEIV